MDPPAFFSTIKAAEGGVMVWGMFSWHHLGFLTPVSHRSYATVLLLTMCNCASLCCHNLPPSTIMHPEGGKAKVVSDWFHEQHNRLSVFFCQLQKLALKRVEHLWDVVFTTMMVHLKNLL